TRIEGGVGFWNLESGQPLRTLKGADSLGTVMAYSLDGKMLAISDRNELQLRDARSLEIITNLRYQPPFGTPYTFRVLSVAFSTNLVAAGYRSGEVKLWDLATWSELNSWKAHANFLIALAFSPDGSVLATGGSDRRVLLWNVRTMQGR